MQAADRSCVRRALDSPQVPQLSWPAGSRGWLRCACRNLVHGSGQQSCSSCCPAVMIIAIGGGLRLAKSLRPRIGPAQE